MQTVGRVVVVAETESDARKAAAEYPTIRGKTYETSVPADKRTTESPWLDRGSSSCTPADKMGETVIAIEVRGSGLRADDT